MDICSIIAFKTLSQERVSMEYGQLIKTYKKYGITFKIIFNPLLKILKNLQQKTEKIA